MIGFNLFRATTHATDRIVQHESEARSGQLWYGQQQDQSWASEADSSCDGTEKNATLG